MTNNAKNVSLPSKFSLIVFVLASTVLADEVSLVPRAHNGAMTRVKTMVDVAGSLKLESGATKKTVEFPMQVSAEMFFDEMGLDGQHSPAVRHYWNAKAELTVNEEKEQRQLRDDRQLIVLNNDPSLVSRFWSPNGMLQRQELDLLDVAGCAFPPELLLPNNEVQNDTWTVDSQVVAQTLLLEDVSTGEITNTIQESTDATVKVEFTGDIEGVADGAKTKIEVRGNYQFDRNTKMITWFAMALRENREMGFGTPGFEVTARIRSARQAIEESDALTKLVVSQANRQATESDLLLEFGSEDELFQTALDRRWYMIRHRNSSVVLRLLDDGDLLATCKVDRLNRMPPGKQITLSGFQEDVQDALADNCKEILSASESVNPQGLRILRVAARGEVKETPIRWIYYHLSDDQGQRLSLIFTHESSLESRLDGIDQAMTSAIALVPRGEQARLQAEQLTR